MKIDLGFWNQQGEYIQDIQEINKMDMDKYFEELNDMANFKGFGEKPEAEEISIDGVDVAECDYYDVGRCQCLLDCSDNKDLFMRQINIDEDLCKDNPNCYYKQLKRLEQENAELKAENERLNKLTGIFSARLCKKYKQALQEIKEIAEKEINTRMLFADEESFCDFNKILQKISEVME